MDRIKSNTFQWLKQIVQIERYHQYEYDWTLIFFQKTFFGEVMGVVIIWGHG